MSKSSHQVLPGYVDAGQAAEYLGCSRVQVLRYLRGDGLVKLAGKRVGKSWIIAVDDLKRFERPPLGNPRHVF